MTHGDDRFHTPRSSARRAGYASSEDERFSTARGAYSARSMSARSENENEYSKQYNGYEEQQVYYSSREHSIEESYHEQDSEFYTREDQYRTPSYVEEYAHEIADIFSLTRHNKISDVEDLLDQGVPVNIKDNHGNTVLSIACQNGLKKMAKAALRRGADINTTNIRGNTPLHFCYAYGYGDTLGDYLLSKGANGKVRNTAGLLCYEGLA